jgi:hypothetical protein
MLKKTRQLRSRSFERLDVQTQYASASKLPVALLIGLFEQPEKN